MPKISESEKTARRERILTGARRCFAQYGYEGATVVRLEQEIGLSRGAIFNWFESKEDIFYELAVIDQQRLTAVYLEEGFEAIVRIICEEDPAWLGVYLEFIRRLRTDADFRTRWDARNTPELRERTGAGLAAAQAAGGLRDDIDKDLIGDFFSVVLDGLVVHRAAGYDVPDPAAIAGLTLDAVTPARRRSPAP